jgi:hypothetical protein
VVCVRLHIIQGHKSIKCYLKNLLLQAKVVIQGTVGSGGC